MTGKKDKQRAPVPEWLLSANTVLTLVLAVAIVLAVQAMIPVRVDANLEMVITKNEAPIGNLNQPRKPGSSKRVTLDALNLAERNRFSHPELGDLGYGNNFFVDVTATFEVTEAGRYYFVIASDDGFALHIDDRLVCQFLSDRALATNRCPLYLDEGEHQFELSYFQGGGLAGLRVQYGWPGESDLHWFGEDSSRLKIQRP